MTDPATLSGRALLDFYAPYLHYDSMEPYRAIAADAMTGHHRPTAKPPGGGRRYANGTKAERTDAIDAARGSYAADARDLALGTRRSRGAPRPVRLVVSLDRKGDDEPPETVSYELEEPRGEARHPLSLEPGDYVGRATTVAADGRVSDTTESTLAVPG